jgi:hypothetical protein
MFRSNKSKRSVSRKNQSNVNRRIAQLHIETKLFQKAWNTLVNYSPTAMYVSSIPQGSDNGNRIGNKIFLKHIEVRMAAQLDASATAGGRFYVRYLLIMDRLNSGSAPSYATVMQSPTGNELESDYANITQRHRFKILYDHTMPLSVAGPACSMHVVTVPVNKTITYVGTDANASSASTNAIYAFGLSNVNALTPYLCVSNVLTFTDD